MKVAAIQMTSHLSVEDNLAEAKALLQIARQKGAQCVLLPENFAFMGKNESDKFKIAEEFGAGPLQDFLRQAAIQGQYTIFGGTIPIRCQNSKKIRATQLVYSPEGECIARYDKIHLFDVTLNFEEKYHESETVEAGSNLVTVDCLGVRIGLSICYDLRFPELYRALLAAGANVLFVPSAFTWQTGRAHWEVLLRARAIENLSFVVAANQCGHHANGRHTWGHSMIVDYWGQVVESLQDEPGVITHELDVSSQLKQRSTFPVLDHLRDSLSPKLTK